MKNYPDYHKPSIPASDGKRFVDLLFDYCVTRYTLYIIFAITPIHHTILHIFDRGWKNELWTELCIYLLFGPIMAVIETIFHGRSLGKLITRTRAVNTDGSGLTFRTALRRNLIRSIPFEWFSALSRVPRPWHDRWSDTMVVYQPKTAANNPA